MFVSLFYSYETLQNSYSGLIAKHVALTEEVGPVILSFHIFASVFVSLVITFTW